MMSVGLHCRLVGRPGRAAALARFLDYVAAHDGCGWRGASTSRAIGSRTHPPAGGYRPSRMGEALFVEVFGDVFEHTPEIARAAHGAGLGPAQDTAEGLHAAMVGRCAPCPAPRSATCSTRIPDLAGRLALAKGLTADSTGEQAGAGLDRLIAGELARFTELNARYRERFGFPFIMAVKGRTRTTSSPPSRSGSGTRRARSSTAPSTKSSASRSSG